LPLSFAVFGFPGRAGRRLRGKLEKNIQVMENRDNVPDGSVYGLAIAILRL